MRVVVAVFGVLAAIAGVEHGVGEMLQGRVRPAGMVIESWPDSKSLEILAGEPALTLVPDLLVTGVLATIVALALGVWSAGFADRRHGPLVLVSLSMLLLLVGGGFGPPLIGTIVGVAATRIGHVSRRRPGPVLGALGRVWPWLLGAAVLGLLALMPGTVLLSRFLGVESPGLVAGLGAWSFGGLLLALIGARARDRERSGASTSRHRSWRGELVVAPPSARSSHPHTERAVGTRGE